MYESLPEPTMRGGTGVGRQAWSPDSVHVLAKPTGAICNLACSYCFFLDKELLYAGDQFRMSDEVLERFIDQLVAAHRTKDVTVAWQGGEPTLMGLDFYKRSIELQDGYRQSGVTFHNTMQTNGTLLTDEWCEFLAEQGFLIGISIDGPRQLHDAYRVTKKGKGTHEKVMRGLRLLQKHRVEYNILTTVNRSNGEYPLEVYRFLRDEAGTEWMQFIPVVERINTDGSNLLQEGAEVTDRSVLPEQFGHFLTEIYDEWVRHDVGTVFVQTFEAALRRWMDLPSGMCVFEETCGAALALEHNGDVYSCDHFVEPRHLLGNLNETDMVGLVGGERQFRFGMDKRDGLPRYCRDCDVKFACNGECPKNRFHTTPDGEYGLNYLCAGYKAFFQHVDHPMRLMAAAMQSGRPASTVMPVLHGEDAAFGQALAAAGRNGQCPCGSGTKVKRCHGDRGGRLAKPLPDSVGKPRRRVTADR